MAELCIVYDKHIEISEMLNKCPNAKLIGTGIIKNYELSFRGSPYFAYATIERKKGGSVPAVMWELNHIDKQRLDAQHNCPSTYVKSYVPVQMNDGEIIEADTYIINGGLLNLPSDTYFKTMQKGYEDFGLDIKVLHESVININELLENDKPYLQLSL